MSADDQESDLEGGYLWRVLSIEEDLLQAVLLHLDCKSLKNFELTCQVFRKFIQRTLSWKKMFEAHNRCYYDDTMDKNLKVVIKRCINRTKGLHLKYKHIVLRLKNLEVNFTKGFNSKDKVNFPKVVGPNGDEFMIRTMDSKLMFIHDEGEFYPSHVFDIENKKQHKVITDTYDMFSIKSSDTENGKLAVLRESDVHLNGNSEVFYVLETYSINTQEENTTLQTCKLKEQSVVQSESSIGICVMVKLSRDKVLLLSIKKENLIMQGVVNIFAVDEEKLVQSGHIFCALPENAFSEKLSLLNSKYFITCRPGRRFVDIWDLNKVEKTTNEAEMIWEKEVVSTKSIPLIKCSAIEFSLPHLFVGKSNGCCDIWNILEDCIIRTLEHGLDTGLNMGIRKIVVFSNCIFSLTDSGWLFAWDKIKSVHPKIGKEKQKDFLSWVIKSRNGKNVTNFVVDHTKIVTIEQHVAKSAWQSKMFLVIRDFWNHLEKKGVSKKDSGSTFKRKTESDDRKNTKRLRMPSTSKSRNQEKNNFDVIEIEDSSDEVIIEEELVK